MPVSAPASMVRCSARIGNAVGSKIEVPGWLIFHRRRRTAVTGRRPSGKAAKQAANGGQKGPHVITIAETPH